MSSLSPKDRVSLCMFSFADGRRCRTPRVRNNPHFCFYHAEKEARARAAEKLGKDLAYFFSGDYLSACDLSTALARLIPAVLRGDVKPRAAHTVAYMAQTLLQAIHISQHEYCEAFSSDAWRESIRNSVNGNRDYRFPPDPEPEQSESPQPQSAQSPTQAPQPAHATQPAPARATQPAPPQPAQTPVNCHSEQSEEPAFSSSSAQPSTQPRPAPSPHTHLPPTSAEFVQQVLAGRNLSRPGREAGSLPATPHIHPAPPTTPSTPPKATSSSPSAPLTTTGATSPAPRSPKPNHLPHSLSIHASQTGTPPGGTSATPVTFPQTAISFRINTCGHFCKCCF